MRTMLPGDVYPFPGGEIVAVAARHPGPRLFLKARADGRALNSRQALAAIADLGSPRVVPMHWDAYDGRSARLGPIWIHELSEALGNQVIRLPVGRSLSPTDRDLTG